MFTHWSCCNSRQCSPVIHDLDESIEFAICAQQEIEFIQIKYCSKDCFQIRFKVNYFSQIQSCKHECKLN
jgi:hypothetical protein